VWRGLDPDLQRVVIGRGPGATDPLSVDLAAAGNVIDVIAKLHDPRKKVEGLHVVNVIGQIVTGTLDANKIEDVRRDPNVISLKGARRLRPTLSNSVPEICASRRQLKEAFPHDPEPLDGTDVIVGIIDHGCDFAHPNFRKTDAHTPGGATRILYLWDQRNIVNKTPPGAGNGPPAPFGYGREFDANAINNALREVPPTEQDPARPHRYLEYGIGLRAHGTPVMDIAAGNGGGLHAPGVAPGADIIFVQESSEDYFMNGDPDGNSSHLLDAVAYVFDKARQLGRRAVVNISLSVQGGPHDGTTLVEEGFDRLLETPGRAIVIAADNLRLDETHVRRTLHPRRTYTLRWSLREDPSGNNNNKVDLWYDGDRALSLILRSPRGYELGPFPLDSTHTIYRKGERAGLVFHRAHDPNNGDNNVVILFTKLMETGVWELDLRLLDDGSRLPIEVHAWTVTDNQRSVFCDLSQIDRTCTLNALGCGHSTIVVGGYNHLEPTKPTLSVSGEGPTRDGRLKPEVSAPAVDIIAANALSVLLPTAAFGATSAATPHVTGLIALLMQSASATLSVEQIREFVIDTARDNPPAPEHGWDTCYGAGRVDAVRAVRALRCADDSTVSLMHGPSTDVAEADTSGDGATTLVVEGRVPAPAARPPSGVARHGSEVALTSLAKVPPDEPLAGARMTRDREVQLMAPPAAEDD
jgi:Subtilase family